MTGHRCVYIVVMHVFTQSHRGIGKLCHLLLLQGQVNQLLHVSKSAREQALHFTTSLAMFGGGCTWFDSCSQCVPVDAAASS